MAKTPSTGPSATPSTVTGAKDDADDADDGMVKAPGATNEGGDPWVDAPQEDHDTPVAQQERPPEDHDLPAYGDSTNLKTDRVWKEGEPDMNAVADTSHTARGNQYPQSQASKENEARALRAEADRLRAEADAAEAKADAYEANVLNAKEEASV